MARARGGDPAALEALLRAHHDRVRLVCRRVTGTDEDGADAAQNALIAIVKGIARFDGRSRFSTWAHRIAVNAALDEVRSRQRRSTVELDDRPSPGDPERDSAAHLDVDAALRRLPVHQRAAVVLRDLCGLDYEEIAEVLDLAPGTVRSRIARGRAALVPLLADPEAADPAPVAT